MPANSYYNKGALDPVTINYISRAGITNGTEINAVNNFVLSCRGNTNIWNSLTGGFVYLVSPTSFGASLHNLLSASFPITIGTAPTYSTSGWAFILASAQYLKTGFVPSSVMTLNTGFMQVTAQNIPAETSFFYGARNTAATAEWDFSMRGATNLWVSHVYNNTTGNWSVSNANSSGNYVFSITASNNQFIRRNLANLGTNTAAGGALPAFECYIGSRNNNGASVSPMTGTIQTLSQGLIGLSVADADAYAGFVNTYNANVISGGR